MARVYDSPTTNLFALLAEEADQPQRKAKANATKGGNELTPKERAAAKAVQDAEHKAKRDAERAKQAEAEARKKAVDASIAGDDFGFAPQRHQRLKEGRVQERAPEGSPKPKGPKGQKGEGKPFKKNDSGENKPVEKKFKGDKPAKTFAGKPDGKEFNKGEKTFNANKPARGREFDKHSQGVVSRKPQAKKGGHGRGNWDDKKPAVAPGATAEEAVNAPTVAATEEGWSDVPDATPATGEAKPEEEAAAVETGKDKEEEDEDENVKTLDEYLAEKEAKRVELEKLVGATAQPRSLTDDEKKALSKFTLVENTKAKKPAKPAAAAGTTAAPKKVKQGPVILEINPTLPRVAGSTRGGRGGDRRTGGDRRGDSQARGEKKGGRVAKPQKLPRGNNFDNAFPALG